MLGIVGKLFENVSDQKNYIALLGHQVQSKKEIKKPRE